MKFATVRELSQNPSKYVDLKDSVIITKHGKPVRAMVYLTEDDLEDFVLADHYQLKRDAEKASTFSKKRKNLPLTRMLKKYSS